MFIYRQTLADKYPSSFGGRRALLQIVDFPAILLELRLNSRRVSEAETAMSNFTIAFLDMCGQYPHDDQYKYPLDVHVHTMYMYTV